MKTKITGILAILLFIFIACSEDQISRPELNIPEIIDILAPSQIFIAETTILQVVIDDPQGAADIRSVQMILNNPASNISTLDMRDDGAEGDIIAGDGQFVIALTAGQWQTAGTANLYIIATDAAGHSSESDTVTIAVLPGSRGSSPRILQIVFADSIRIDSTYDVQLLATVEDENGLATIDRVEAAFYRSTAATPELKLRLNDDGQSDDGIAGNGIFGAEIISSASGFVRAAYLLRVIAIDQNGNRSKAGVKTFFTTKPGEIAPEILSVTAPDTISRSAGEPIVLNAQVIDRNGLDDIRLVIFNTFKPDGTPSSGNPFSLRDDGVKDALGFGDATAGDGEYTAVISIDAANATGNYRFEFQAEDKTGLKSEKVNHILTVIE